MRTRIANYADVAALVKLCRRHHEANDWNFLPFSPTKVRENLVGMIRTEGTDVLLVEDDEGLQGILLAGLDQFFMNKQWYATDIHFVCDKGGRALLQTFFDWAQAHGAKCVVMGVATSDPEGRIARFYELMGMEQKGTAWVKVFHVEHEEQAA